MNLGRTMAVSGLTALLATAAFCTGPEPPPAGKGSEARAPITESNGALNHNAPPELARFGFLIGRWSCEARIKGEGEAWETFPATWTGRYVLEGHAIMDEYRMTRPGGELIVLGVNIRAYDPARQTWTMKWLNALGGTWVDLGPEDLGGVSLEDGAIRYVLREPLAAHPLTRATYFDISGQLFRWRGERSQDGAAWEEFMRIDCRRVE